MATVAFLLFAAHFTGGIFSPLTCVSLSGRRCGFGQHSGLGLYGPSFVCHAIHWHQFLEPCRLLCQGGSRSSRRPSPWLGRKSRAVPLAREQNTLFFLLVNTRNIANVVLTIAAEWYSSARHASLACRIPPKDRPDPRPGLAQSYPTWHAKLDVHGYADHCTEDVPCWRCLLRDHGGSTTRAGLIPCCDTSKRGQSPHIKNAVASLSLCLL